MTLRETPGGNCRRACSAARRGTNRGIHGRHCHRSARPRARCLPVAACTPGATWEAATSCPQPRPRRGDTRRRGISAAPGGWRTRRPNRATDALSAHCMSSMTSTSGCWRDRWTSTSVHRWNSFVWSSVPAGAWPATPSEIGFERVQPFRTRREPARGGRREQTSGHQDVDEIGTLLGENPSRSRKEGPQPRRVHRVDQGGVGVFQVSEQHRQQLAERQVRIVEPRVRVAHTRCHEQMAVSGLRPPRQFAKQRRFPAARFPYDEGELSMSLQRAIQPRRQPLEFAATAHEQRRAA